MEATQEINEKGCDENKRGMRSITVFLNEEEMKLIELLKKMKRCTRRSL